MIGELSHSSENSLFSKFNVKKIDAHAEFEPKVTIDENDNMNLESIDLVYIDKIIPLMNVKTVGNYKKDSKYERHVKVL